VNPVLAQREIALAGIALLAAVTALAISSKSGGSDSLSSLPKPVPVAGGWYTALAGPVNLRAGQRTKCGVLIKQTTPGVIDPVLPCGVKLYLAYKDSPRILTQVIDRRAVLPGRRFDVTQPLAEKLGLDGVQRVQWVYAR
jgi:hypothetical protein